MDVNWLNSASLIKKVPWERMKAKTHFLWRWWDRWGKKAGVRRRQDCRHCKLDKGNWETNEEKEAHWRQIFIMACAIPNNKNSFISVTFSLLLNPTPHISWFLITPILDFLVIIHIGSLITASTETEMKSRTEYLYTWCQIKLLCQVFQSRVVRKLNQNSLRNGSSDKFRISVPEAFRQRRIKRSCTWH